MYGYVGYVLYAWIRTKVRKGLGAFLIHLCTVYLVLRRKKVHIRGLGRILISCASESEISEAEEKNEQPGYDRF